MSTHDVDHDDMGDDADAFLTALRAEHEQTLAPPAGDLLAALFRDGAAPVATPAPIRRRWARVAVAGAVAGVFGVGGLGVAGALPRPVQDTVADLADVIGVELPRDEPDRPATPSPTNTTGRPVPKTPATADGPATPLPARPGDPGRPEEDPGRSGDAPGRADEGAGRRDDTPAPAEGTSRRPEEVPGTVADRGRNPEAPVDVDPSDRTGLVPQDHGGPNR